MALALGDCILERGEIDALAIAGAFDTWLQSKPVDVGHTIRRGILHFRHTGATCVPENHFDAGNGVCMQVLPVALATLGQPASCVQAACRTQTHVTHNNPLSDAGIECMAFMIQAALRGASRLELLHGAVKNLLTTHPLFRFRGRRRDNPIAYIVETLQAVFQALFDTNDFRDCLVVCHV